MNGNNMLYDNDDDDDDGLFNLFSVGAEGDSPHHTQTLHTCYDSSRRAIGPSQRPLSVQHTTLIRDRRPYYRRESNPQSHQRSGRISTP